MALSRCCLPWILFVSIAASLVIVEASQRIVCTKANQIIPDRTNVRCYRKCIVNNGYFQPKKYCCGECEFYSCPKKACVEVPGGGKIVEVTCRKKSKGISLYPDESDPTQYFANTPVGILLMKCPLNTQYDEDEQVCKSVIMKRKPCTKKMVYKLPKCVRAGKFPVRENERLYYTCSGSPGHFERSVRSCPRGMKYCPAKGCCVSTHAPTNVDTSYPACTEMGWFRAPLDCRKYYSCIRRFPGGKLYQTRYCCPEGQAFCVQQKICLPRHHVPECNATPLPEIDIYPCNGAGNFPTASASGYYSCNAMPDGTFDKKFHTCPPGFVYCQSRQSCVMIEQPLCKPTSTCTKPGWYADKEKCGYYYHCVPNDCGGYNQTFYQCPQGTAFDETSGVCSSEAMSKCKNPFDSFPAGTNFICTKEGTFATYDCEGYCTCTKNQVGDLVKTCSRCKTGDFYSEDLGICTCPEKSNCVPMGTNNFFFVCTQAGVFPVLNGCAYVTCTTNPNGTYSQTINYCPCGTKYNETVGLCVTPACVKTINNTIIGSSLKLDLPSSLKSNLVGISESQTEVESIANLVEDVEEVALMNRAERAAQQVTHDVISTIPPSVTQDLFTIVDLDHVATQSPASPETMTREENEIVEDKVESKSSDTDKQDIPAVAVVPTVSTVIDEHIIRDPSNDTLAILQEVEAAELIQSDNDASSLFSDSQS